MDPRYARRVAGLGRPRKPRPPQPKPKPKPPKPERPVGHSEALAHLANQERIIVEEFHRDQWPPEYGVALHWFPDTSEYRQEQRWARKPHPIAANQNIVGPFFGAPPPPRAAASA